MLATMVSVLFSLCFLNRQLPEVVGLPSNQQNLLHFPAFALLFLSLRWIFRGCRSTRVDLAVTAAALALGCLIEILQPFFGRNASWLDMSLDVVGICTGYVLWRVANGTLARPWLLLCTFVAAIVFIQPAQLYAQWQREQAFPNLLDFDQDSLTAFVEVQGAAELSVVGAPITWHDNPTRVGLLKVTTGPWPGIYLRPSIADWRDYEAISFQVYSPYLHSMTVSLRIDDSHYDGGGDNFDQKYAIVPGVNNLHISLSEVRKAPRERALDMGNIALLFLYVPQPEDPIILYLDNFRLVLSDSKATFVENHHRKPSKKQEE
jgi:VanZ family protein